MNGLWRRAVCVLGLLVGLLAMHALAPGGAAPMTHMAQAPTVHTVVRATAAEAQDPCSGCGHVQHADAACSAAALSGAPALPGLLADPARAAVRGPVVGSRVPVAPDAARAPPSLAELQLLRI